FNRRRLTEDAVAALDSTVDWDSLVTRPGGTNYMFGATLLPPGLLPAGLASGGRGLFQLPAPSMDLPINLREEPGNPISPVYWSDFACDIGGKGETGQNDAGFQKGLMAHEFLH